MTTIIFTPQRFPRRYPQRDNPEYEQCVRVFNTYIKAELERLYAGETVRLTFGKRMGDTPDGKRFVQNLTQQYAELGYTVSTYFLSIYDSPSTDLFETRKFIIEVRGADY